MRITLALDAPTVLRTTQPELNETRPINCANWYQSYAFCIWDGGFLPTEAEWNYAAAGGSEQRPYPWGASLDHDHAVYDCQYNGLGTCGSMTNIAPVGTLAAGQGRWGQSALAGNLWEWSLDWYASPYATPCVDCYNDVPPPVQPPPSGRVVRGGAFFTGGPTLTTSNRLSTVPTLRLYGFGLRCARSP